uniref:Uncharacterized protein n=1 Tax=Timema tahoe TaxID=61484 RepID=A0A7R9IT51_9NEOP|nr:unnamed protein product [Timema tahoe]
MLRQVPVPYRHRGALGEPGSTPATQLPRV